MLNSVLTNNPNYRYNKTYGPPTSQLRYDRSAAENFPRVATSVETATKGVGRRWILLHWSVVITLKDLTWVNSDKCYCVWQVYLTKSSVSTVMAG